MAAAAPAPAPKDLHHLTKISDYTPELVMDLIRTAIDMKAHPHKYSHRMDGKTLLMLFEKPSLRTRVSFETGMTQMGGHAIHYSIQDSPLGKKETYADTARCLSRYVNVVMARVKARKDIRELCKYSTVPIINALDDFAHPCQMLADLQVIVEKKGRLTGLKMAYCGDIKNNVTYDLMRAACMMGMEIRVAGPKGPDYDVEQEVLDECKALGAKYGGSARVCATAAEAVTGVDIVYCDSWMSYGIPDAEKDRRIAAFMPFQVTAAIMALAKHDAIFMNCLPAMRGMEMTAEVIDGPQSIVFDEAENRLHAQKALLCYLIDQAEGK